VGYPAQDMEPTKPSQTTGYENVTGFLALSDKKLACKNYIAEGGIKPLISTFNRSNIGLP
jgi:hypothetical protein